MDVVNRANNSRRRWGVVVTLAALLSSLGCSAPPADDAGDAGTTVRPDLPEVQKSWEVVTVADQNVGLHVRFDTSAETLGLAYYGMTGEEAGECEELGDAPPARIEWTLYHASQTAGGPWEVETVGRSPFVGQPSGLGFRYDPDGVAHVATMTGVPDAQIRYCGVNDVGLLRREGGGWTTETAVATSGEAASGFEPSDYGAVVGYWPALAFDGDGRPGIVYKDVHAGGMQSDDFTRADLEFAIRQTQWSATPVDFGNGAGTYSDIIVDDRGRWIVVTVNPVENSGADERGIWVYRSTDGTATEWERVRLHNQGTVEGPSIVQSGDGLHVAFYNPEYGYPRLATLPTGGAFDDVASWSFEDIGDSRYDEGYETSLAVAPAPDSRLAIAYYRCGRSTSGLGNCDSTNDGLVFAWRDAGSWEHEVVDHSDGFCGRGPQLRFAAGGEPIIAYRCEATTPRGLESEVRVARRGGAP